MTMDNTAQLPEEGVTAATRTARRVVLFAFAATSLLVGALIAERVVFHWTSARAVADIKAALEFSHAIVLEDERLTMSANLHAVTGDQRWAQRYEAHIPLIDQAIASAAALAPPGAAQRFNEATRVANDALVEMERNAFALVQAGDLARAQAVLDSAAYGEQKAVLLRGSQAFMAELQSAVEARLQELNRRSWLLLAALVLLAMGAFYALWRHLIHHLRRAEAAFAAKRDEVTRLALHDTLTGLPNRRYLHMQLEVSIARAARENTHFALLMIDLDGFKPVNDRYGHAAGDAVLTEISRRLNANVRKSETAARLGGDEFVVLLNDGEASDAPVRAAQRLITVLSEPIQLPHGEVRIGASVGVALFPADGRDADDLIRKADVALYRAKSEARGEVRFFQQSMDEEVREREVLELDLRNAIANGQIVPYFQPLVDLASGELTGFEVLARWHHPSRGMIAPAVFIPVAEDSGQIDALTLCIMRRALTLAREWAPHLSIAVNIAPQQLRNESLIDRLVGVLHEVSFPPERFEIEITENALIADLDLARKIVVGLKEHGVRVALDDFGTGYSSLSHLSELPFDKIKIDRSFIHTMHKREESASIVHAIIALGRSLNLPTTAEGIESEADVNMLTKLGCNVGQGFLYSKPMPADDVASFIELHNTRELALAS
jgi:diguanylate cyclase (GGDEF)-like protein